MLDRMHGGIPRGLSIPWLLVALMPAAAEAAPGPPAERPNAEQLRAYGVSVAWPLRAGSVEAAPGTTLTVRVRRIAGHRGRVVRVTFARTTRSGKILKRIAGKRLRRGTFRVRVPKQPGRQYVLTLRVGKRTYRGWVRTAPPTPASPEPASPPVTAGPVPLVPGPGGPQYADPVCALDAGTSAASVTPSPAVVAAGAALDAVIQNTGARCLQGVSPYLLARRVGDEWVEVPVGNVSVEGRIYRPGDTYPLRVHVPAESPPGRYRVIVGLLPTPFDPVSPTLTLFAEFDVVAAA